MGREIGGFLDALARWAGQQPDMTAVVLVGSFARGAARADSDIDLVMMTSSPQRYLEDDAWPGIFGTVLRSDIEDWGMVQSKRVFYADGLEVEYGITVPQWADIDPVDAGTRAVIADGAQIVHDPQGLAEMLIRTVMGTR